MIAYTGIETVSNLSEEARDPVRSIPRSIPMVAIAVFAIYFTLPLDRALGDAGALDTATTRRCSASARRRAASRTTRCSALVEHLGIDGTLLSVLKIYVGLLAATILFIATNAGVIGASRITYAMAGYRQLPALFRRLHPKFKTPWLSLVVFAGFVSILVLLPGKTTFLGRCTRSARCSRSPSRTRRSSSCGASARARSSRSGRGRTSAGAASTGRCSRSSAASGRGSRGSTSSCSTRARATPASAGSCSASPSTSSTAAGSALAHRDGARAGRSSARRPRSSTGRSSCPIAPGYASDEAMDIACRLATERRATIVALTVDRGPARAAARRRPARGGRGGEQQLDEARAIGESYGVRVIPRLVRARNSGRAIVDEAKRRGRGDHRHGRRRGACGSRPGGSGSSATPSTSCSSTRPAA